MTNAEDSVQLTIDRDVLAASLAEDRDSGRLAEAFRGLTGPERQLIVCALAGRHPANLAALRPLVLRGLAKAGSRLTAEQRQESRG